MAKEKETKSGATEEHKATQLNIFKEKKSPELRVHSVNHKIITNLVWNSVTRIAQLAVTRVRSRHAKGTREAGSSI